jgi:ribosomal protein S18 acetylase RimI-like enzyme
LILADISDLINKSKMIEHFISTDKTKLDLKIIHEYLSKRSYWAKSRTIETVKQSIENSLSFGMYNQKEQLIGFGRAVTDYSIFAYLMDIFILEEYQNQGLGKKMMEYILNCPELKGLTRIMLGTRDAQEFYRRFGFNIFSKPENFMEIVSKTK